MDKVKDWKEKHVTFRDEILPELSKDLSHLSVEGVFVGGLSKHPDGLWKALSESTKTYQESFQFHFVHVGQANEDLCFVS